MSEMMTPKEVATMFRVTEGTVLKWFKAGTLPGVKVQRAVRFESAAVESLRRTGKAS